MKYIFISFAWDDFDDPWLTRQYIMNELSKQGKVLYFTLSPAFDEIMTALKSFQGLSKYFPRITEINPSLKHIKAGVFFPRFFIRRQRLNRFSEMLKSWFINAYIFLKNWKGKRVLYIWNPDYYLNFESIKHDLSIFHCDDYFPNFYKEGSPEHARMLNNLEICLQKADIVLTTCDELEKKLTSIVDREYTRFVHGVNIEEYQRQDYQKIPDSLASIPSPRLAHIGRINNKINTKLLAIIARNNPDWSVILMGPTTADLSTDTLAGIEELGRLNNGHILPGVEPEDLPKHCNAIDIGLMAYHMGRWVLYSLPMKYFEYLAAGKPMVCAPIPSMMERSEFVTCATTPDDWINAIKTALDSESEEKRKKRLQESSGYSWANRAGRINELISERFEN